MPTIVVDDVEVPAEERTFLTKLQVLGPDYDFQITLREAEWLPRSVENVRVFLEGHKALAGAVTGYLLKTIADIFKAWALDRLKRAPGNTEKLTIYGPDGKPLKVVTVKTGSIEE
jgi:hypothetical protein